MFRFLSSSRIPLTLGSISLGLIGLREFVSTASASAVPSETKSPVVHVLETASRMFDRSSEHLWPQIEPITARVTAAEPEDSMRRKMELLVRNAQARIVQHFEAIEGQSMTKFGGFDEVRRVFGNYAVMENGNVWQKAAVNVTVTDNKRPPATFVHLRTHHDELDQKLKELESQNNTTDLPLYTASW